MKKVLMMVLVLGLSLEAGARRFERIPTESGNYCEDEMAAFLEKKFGPSVLITNITYYPQVRDSESRNWRAYVTTNACRGHFIFKPVNFFSSDITECRGLKFGSSYPHYVGSVYATKKCKKLLPKRAKVERRRRDF